jgi:hypothetical protein
MAVIPAREARAVPRAERDLVLLDDTAVSRAGIYEPDAKLPDN